MKTTKLTETNTTATSPIIVVGSDAPTKQILLNVGKELKFNIVSVPTITDLYTCLVEQKTVTESIIINLNHLCSVEGSSLIEVLNTIRTLNNARNNAICSPSSCLCRTNIAVIVNKDVNVEDLRNIQSTDVTVYIPENDWTAYGDINQGVVALIKNQTFIPKKIQELFKKNKKTLNKKPTTNKDEIQLTARQEQVLSLIRDRGSSNKVIANILKISESTVKLHITAILRKYGARNRTQLALFSSRQKNLIH